MQVNTKFLVCSLIYMGESFCERGGIVFFGK